MNSFRLPILATSAVAVLLALSPVALSAQSLAVSPGLYAAAEAPATYSSSSVSDASAIAPAATESYAAAASSAAAAAPVVQTETSTRPFSALGVGFKIGIGGVGFDVATPLAKRFNVRGGAGFFSYNINSNVNNQPVTGSLKLNNAEVMLDYFPFNGSFRLAAGMTIYNNTGISATITPTAGSKVTIGNVAYYSSPTNPITGTVSAKFGGDVVPRFTLGWGNLAKRNGHWSFDTEFGIEVTGTPTVGWTFAGQGCTGSSTCTNYGAVNPADIATQNASLQSDFNSYKIFPIFNIGIGYKIGK